MDSELKQHFQRAGAAHILAVSGLHTGIVYTVVLTLLTLGGLLRPMHDQRLWHAALAIVTIGLLWGYAWLTGMSAPVVRSVVMMTIYEIGILLRRPTVSLNTLMAAAIVILLFRPSELLSVGFWLSFSAVAALLTMMPHLTMKNRFVRALISLPLVSMIAQLGTLPITLYAFGQMSNYFLLTNLIVVPLAFAIVYLGFGVQVLAGVPGVGSMLGWLLRGVAWLLNSAVGWIESLPGAVTTIHETTSMMVLLYAAIVMGVLSLRHSLYWLLGVVACMCAWCALYIMI